MFIIICKAQINMIHLFSVCPPIQNCVHRTCEAYYGSNNKCEYCKYENTHQRYERAYKYHDDKKICERMYVLQYKLCQF